MHTAAEPSTINRQAMNVQRRIEKREPVNKASLSACRQCDSTTYDLFMYPSMFMSIGRFQWLPERYARRCIHSGTYRPPVIRPCCVQL